MAHFEAQTFHEPLCRVSVLPQAVLLPRGLQCRASIAKAASEVSCVVSPEYNFLGIGMCDNQMAHPRRGTSVAQGGYKMITGCCENKIFKFQRWRAEYFTPFLLLPAFSD